MRLKNLVFEVLAVAAIVLFVHRAEASAAERPNFLFIYTDDQRWDAMGVVQREQGDRARFPWFTTPNLDRLAAEGVRFRNAFVVNSLCAPSRANYLTSRYSHLNGVANNHTPFPEDSVTHATLLRGAGYATGYIGKWHMGRQSGQRPGFDYSASFIGQGQYNNCPFEINGQPTPTEGWVDDRSTDFAIEFMKKHKAGPFSLVVGFKTTHGPWQPPDRAAGRFADETIRPAANADVKAIYGKGIEGVAKNKAANKKNAAAKKKAAGAGGPGLNYFRCISAADDNVGRMLRTLDELGVADNTVVIFSSDNGYYLGEHGLGDKRSAYDESLRLPMLLRYPRLSQARGKLVDAMVLNIDVAPTLLDLAGVAIPKSMQGRSWRPLLEGTTPADWRSSYFYEYFFENGYATPTVLAVRTESAKIIKYPGHDQWTEIFDLKADPYEKTNLASDPAHKELRDRLEAEFARQKEAVQFRVPEYADVPPG